MASGSVPYVDDATAVFFLSIDAASRTGRFFVFDRANEDWRLIADGVPLGDAGIRYVEDQQLAAPVLAGVTRLSVDQELGIAAYIIERAEGYDLLIFDLNRMEPILLARSANVGRVLSLSMRSVQGLDGVLVETLQEGSDDEIPTAFSYDLPSGNSRNVPILGNEAELLYLNASGDLIYHDHSIDAVFRQSAGQAAEQVWPQP
jgi:hypothetical protein